MTGSTPTPHDAKTNEPGESFSFETLGPGVCSVVVKGDITVKNIQEINFPIVGFLRENEDAILGIDLSNAKDAIHPNIAAGLGAFIAMQPNLSRALLLIKRDEDSMVNAAQLLAQSIGGTSIDDGSTVTVSHNGRPVLSVYRDDREYRAELASLVASRS